MSYSGIPALGNMMKTKKNKYEDTHEVELDTGLAESLRDTCEKEECSNAGQLSTN
jgi:hypothetical protein